MARTRTLETPGTTAAAPSSDAPAPDAFQAQATELTPSAEPVDPNDLAAVVAAQAKQIAALLGAVQQMQANAGAHPAAHVATVEKHPALDELDLSKVTAPLMTDKGWYVPPKWGSNPSGDKV